LPQSTAELRFLNTTNLRQNLPFTPTCSHDIFGLTSVVGEEIARDFANGAFCALLTLVRSAACGFRSDRAWMAALTRLARNLRRCS